jgi:hypothetical protein
VLRALTSIYRRLQFGCHLPLLKDGEGAWIDVDRHAERLSDAVGLARNYLASVCLAAALVWWI